MSQKKSFLSNKAMPEEVRKEKVFGEFRLSNHLVPFYLYVPAVIFSFVYGLYYCGIPPLVFAMYFVISIPLWSLFEYVAHRWILHAKPKSAFWQKVLYGAHTGHHDYPKDVRFHLTPLEVSIPALFIFYGFYYLLLGVNAHAFMAGWVSIYLIYDWLHYAVHNYNFNNRWYKLYQQHHIDHHFIDEETNFGFISLAWDELFGTKLTSRKLLAKERNKELTE